MCKNILVVFVYLSVHYNCFILLKLLTFCACYCIIYIDSEIMIGEMLLLDFDYIYILTAVALGVLVTIVRRSSYFEERKNKFFVMGIFADMLILLGYVGRDLSEQYKNILLAHFSNTMIYMCAPLSMFFLIYAATKKPDKLTKICFILETASILIALSSFKTGWFYTVSSDVIYSRGTLYLYNEVLGIVFTILWAVYSFIEFKYIDLIDKFCLSEIFVLQVLAIIIQGQNSTYKIIYIGGAFNLMIYYAFVTEVYGKYDKLTGVRNRQYYHSMLTKNKFLSRYSIIMADANELKSVNDTYGHAEGDKLICAVATAMNNAVGKKGHVYRIGGDEFVAVIKTDDKDVAEEISNVIQKTLLEKNEQEYRISASLGIAVHQNDESFSQTVERADRKMYENKNKYYIETGKNRRKY